MRKHKFRVWDKKLNKWYEPTYTAFSGKLHELVINMRGVLGLRTMDGFYGTDPDSSPGTLLEDRFLLMQFTGLHDKEGKEIYEGDILQFVTEDNKVPNEFCKPQIVSFENGCYSCAHGAIGYTDGTKRNWKLSELIVGNIHQNPELLK